MVITALHSPPLPNFLNIDSEPPRSYTAIYGPRLVACEAVESVPGKLGGTWVVSRNAHPRFGRPLKIWDDGLTISEIVALYEGLLPKTFTLFLDFACRSLEAPTPVR